MFKLKNETAKVLGKPTEVFGQTLYLRSLTLGTMKELEPRLNKLNGLVGTEDSPVNSLSGVIDNVLDVVELLVKRDYEFDRKEFEDTLDIEEVHIALPVMLESCGLAQKKTN